MKRTLLKAELLKATILNVVALTPLTFVFGVVLWLLAPHASAHTLLEIYDMARSHDPAFKTQELSIMAAKEVLPQSRAALLPTLSVSGNTRKVHTSNEDAFIGNTLGPAGVLAPVTGQVSNDYNAIGYSAELNQPLFDPQKWYRYKQGQALFNQQEWEQVKAEQDLITRVTTSYFNVLREMNELTSLQAEKRAVKKQSEQLQRHFEAGLVDMTDVYEVKAALDRIRVRIIQANNRLQARREELIGLTGRGDIEVQPVFDSLIVEEIKPGNEKFWKDLAMQNNAEIKVANIEIAAAKENKNAARSEHMPTISISASYFADDSGVGGYGKAMSDTSTLSLNLNMKLFQGGAASSRSREAALRLDESKLRYLDKIREIEQNTATLFRTIHADVASVNMLKLTVNSHEEALKAVKAGYRMGIRNAVDVLQAQKAMFLAKRTLIDATYDYVSNIIELKRLVGVVDRDSLVFSDG
ncbi:TolC family outer membrane protein [Alkalimarinus coralli]|uniref:TolC family outer membrane protein n=1 Tax=Alkalimarinus coralli TaxID=2935863 RepID=UPI00202B28C5|nr:TolC family outer membrane protein [Alkalimarinus coralli]